MPPPGIRCLPMSFRSFPSGFPPVRNLLQTLSDRVHDRNSFDHYLMRVLVTGGTGYVGSHSVAALARAGQRVRVLARSPERVPAALEPLGVDGVETAIGDVTDLAAV